MTEGWDPEGGTLLGNVAVKIRFGLGIRVTKKWEGMSYGDRLMRVIASFNLDSSRN